MASQSQQVILLFKKNFGVGDTQDSSAVSQESIAARSRIIPSQQIFSQAIPTTKPTDFVKDDTFNAANGQRYYSQANPHIVYYSSIKLGAINLFESYWFTSATLANPGANILSSAVPTTYGDGSYTINVYDCNAVPLLAGGTYPWTFDPDGGILKFYTNLTSANAPPTVTYYRYEGTFGLTATTNSNYLTLSSGNLFVSSLNFIDATTQSTNYLTTSSGGLFFNGSTLFGNYITQANLTSTIIGLGTVGYLSSATSAIIPNGLVSTANLAELVSTSFLTNALTSTIIGLGTVGYLSSATSAIIPSGLVSTANLATLVSTTYLETQLGSTVVGLGTAGYISSSQLLSTSLGLTQYISSFIDPTELTSTVVGLGTQGFVSSFGLTYAVASTAQGLGTFGYTSTSQLLSTSLGLYQEIQNSPTAIVQANLTSTVIGLGTAGYISTVVFGSVVSTANLVNLVSSANLANLVSTANLAALVSTTYLASQLTSTVIGLGTAGYISSGQLLSTTYGYSQNFITQNASVSSLRFSTATGLNAYISSLTIDQLVFGDGNGWADFGALRAAVLSSYQINTGIVYAPIISTSQIIGVSFLTQANLTSTVIGLGTTGYLSSALTNIGGFGLVSTANLSGLVSTANLSGLVSTANLTGLVSTANLTGLVSTANLTGLVSTANLSGLVSTANLATLVSTIYLATQLGSTVIGLGTAGYLSSIPALGGFVSTANLAGVVSTANLATLVSTSYLATQLGSTVIGLGTVGYLSSIPTLAGLVSTANLTGVVSTANLATLVSTTYLATQLGSTVIGLGTAGYISSIPALAGLVSTANLATLVSTTYLATQLTSTVLGLGTVGYISSSQLLSTSLGLSQYISSFIDPTELTSTVIGLGTQGFVSSFGLTYAVASTAQGLGTFGYTSTSQLLSTSLGLYQEIQNSGTNIVQADLTSTVIGLGTAGYLSTVALASVVSTANLATLVSTTYLATQLGSTVIGLGTAGYLSSIRGFVSTANLVNLVSTANLANLISTANLATLVSTANLATLVSTSYLATQLGSTVRGLGTAGYLSSINYSTVVLSSLTAQNITSVQGYISSLYVDSLFLGSNNAFIEMGDIVTTSVSTIQINTGSMVGITISAQQLYVSSIQATNIIGALLTANLTSTVIGLGTVGYLSSATATANLANLVSTANLANLVSTANLTTLVSTTYLATQLGSTVIGLGTAGYLSTQISTFLTLSTGNLIVSSITFNSPSSAPVGNNVFVSSSLFYFNQFVIGGTRVQEPQIFTF